MQSAKTVCRERWGRRKPRLLPRLGLAAELTALLWTGASAAEYIDCAAIGSGAMSVDLATIPSTMREVTLKAGDRLAFNFRAGAVTLVVGASSRALLPDPTGSATYVADRDGPVAFRFTRQGNSAPALTATCTPAAGSRRAKAGAPAVPTHWDDLPPIEEAEIPKVDAEVDTSAQGRGAPFAAHPPIDPGPAGRGASSAGTGLDARLKWEGRNDEIGAAPTASTAAGSADPATTLGVKYRLQPQIMVGVLAQFDQTSDALLVPRAPLQQTWLAGPTASVQLAPGLALDARAAWGSGEAGALDRVAGIWATERRLVDAKLASTQSFGAWRFSPSVTLNYADEKPAGTAAATHDPLAPRITGAGRVDVTPELAYRIEMPQAMFIEPKAAIGSFWDIDALSRLAPRGPAHEDMRLKAEAGVTIGGTAGTKLEVGGGVEGGGAATPDVWTGRLQLSVPLK